MDFYTREFDDYYDTGEYLRKKPNNDGLARELHCIYRAARAVKQTEKQTKLGIALAKGFSDGIEIGTQDILDNARLNEYGLKLPGAIVEETVFLLLEVQSRVYSEVIKVLTTVPNN